MAILEMRKVTAIALTSERDKLLQALIKHKASELIETPVFEGDNSFDGNELKERASLCIALISFALDYIKNQRNYAKPLIKKGLLEYKPPKKSLLAPQRPSVTEEELKQAYEDSESIISKARELEKLSGEEISLKSDATRLSTTLESLSLYSNINLPFSSFKDSSSLSLLLGTITTDKLKEVNLEESLSHSYYSVEEKGKLSVIVITCPIERKKEVLSLLSTLEFSMCPYKEGTPSEMIEEIESRLDWIEKRKLEVISEALALEGYEWQFKVLYDYYSLELKKLEASERFGYTSSTFALSFWTPLCEYQRLEELLKSEGLDVLLFAGEPAEDEVVPTLTQNNAIVAPFEDITNMYSVPSYREKDPNGIMSIFYFVLFGVMLGDAAYGIILSLACFIFYALKKPRKGESRILLILGFCGISTAIWGTLFGSWFGESLVPWYWFNPLEEPLKMLILSMALGFIQIVVSMFLNALNLFREGKVLDAIFNVFGWYVIFIGLALFASPMLIDNLPEGVKNAGLIVLIVGVVMILIGGALGKKNILKALMGGFKNIYGVTNYLSDILSYARLFGLGLATGVVAMVINQICVVIRSILPGVVGAIFGWAISIVIYVVGHIFNLAINTLGTYVHNCRLQYVEFYGRFYTGGGHAFLPFGADTKYTYLEGKKD